MDESQQAKDAQQLRALGYAQELLRGMGGFSNFALSFSVISILTGAVTLYGHGLRWGGPYVMLVGWPLVCGMTCFVAASMAELASSFPTAGALYHWAAMLGGRPHGFFTAWLNVIGQLAVTAAVDFGLAQLLAAMFSVSERRGVVLAIYGALLLSQAVLNHIGVSVVAKLNDFSAWYHLGGVVVLVVAVLFFAPRQPLSFLTTKFNGTDHGYAYAFLIGLLQAQWTMTGYDASAHVTEETVNPAVNAPRGVFLSVVVSGVAGFIMLAAVTLAISDLPRAVNADSAFLEALTQGTGALAPYLTAMVAGAMWLCGISSVTSNSRMLYAFARDGGAPRSATLRKVSPRFQSPHVAIWVSVSVAFAIALWAETYDAMVALSTIALYASYALPIAIGFLARRNGRWTQRGPWHLGRWSAAVNLLALGWVAFITVLFVLPPNQLAGYTFAGALVLLAIYWFSWMRKRFKGPAITAR